jgi:carbonic anhydrase
METLLQGYRRFRASNWREQQSRFEALAAGGQRPHALVIACVDSRIDPAMIFDSPPGEMLTVRNVANLVPPYAPDVAYHGTSAAIEFGVRVLGVRNVVVFGHESCGGIRALLEGAPENARDFVAPWMAMAEAARARALRSAAPADRQRCAEHEAIKVSLANLLTFPWVAQAVASGALALHGAWFGIGSGELHLLGRGGTFQPAA